MDTPRVYILAGLALTLSPSALATSTDPVDRSTSRVGLGLGTAGGRTAAGLDMSGSAPAGGTRVYFDLEQRYYRAPPREVEQALVDQGVTTGVQSYWAGTMRFGAGARLLLGDTEGLSGEPQGPLGIAHVRPGVELGLSWRHERIVAAKVQDELMASHDVYWGPLWAMHLGPEARVGVHAVDDWLSAGVVGRAHLPLGARLDTQGRGVELDGWTYDPVQIIRPEVEVGPGLRYRYKVAYVDVEAVARWTLPSVYEQDVGNDEWGRDLRADVAIGVGF